MKLHEALGINLSKNELISFVGAGGKTTSLFRLAKELKECEKRVLVTTTTAMYSPDERSCDEVILARAEGSDVMSKRVEPCICALGAEITGEKKLQGVDGEYINRIFFEEVFDCILVEADGSKQRSIKAPADHEPVIPGATTKVVGVVGLDVLGSKISSSTVHRPEYFCPVAGRGMGDIIDEGVIAKLILEPEGLFKSSPEGARQYVLLNRADRKELQMSAIFIVETVKKNSFNFDAFVVADMLKGNISKVL